MQAPLSFTESASVPRVAAEKAEQRSGLGDALGTRRPVQPAAGKIARWSETHARSLVKAVSWRATGSLDTFVVAFLVTGNPKIAGSVALTEIVTKIVIYYCHERLWALVPWGKRSRQAVAEQSG
ncbi:MAG: DUF2061 domain-containing protein [Xanthobacteraceae bacterium]